ncbi:MAG: helix-turn-helix transcriptional regulator [Clostridiales bacterium]|nr:helix-turn-helix transcriptional regulator [Clostridiales bacterium]
MDYNKIGNFIAEERKAKKLTQAKLAEKIFVSEKTVSKWENGKGVPDTDSLPKLCEVLDFSVNELLNGERVTAEEYVNKAEENLISLRKAKEDGDKRLLATEVVLSVVAIVYLLALTVIVSVVQMPEWTQSVIIGFGVVVTVIAGVFALRIEQVAGFYECGKCGYKYVPTYKQVFFATHISRARRLKCPHCHQKSWHKKVIK